MSHILSLIQIVLAILLVVGVLLQRSEAGLGSAFGGDGMSMHTTRRGFEKKLFIATIVVCILFAISAFMSLFQGL